MNANNRTVAILGAGVAGLAVAKTLRQHGFDVTIYEARAQAGGVWANNYKSLCVLEPNCVYGYPDWPWPDGTALFPPAAQVRAARDAGFSSIFAPHHYVTRPMRMFQPNILLGRLAAEANAIGGDAGVF